jgi:predicted dehydrogenase
VAHIIRVGVVGCGEVAQIIHLPTLRDLPHLFEVTALCDISRTVVEAAGRFLPEARLYESHAALIADPEVDAVLIANPHVYHAEVAIAAMAAGKHVLVEKPMCISLEEADRLAEAEAKYGVTVQVGFMRRHAPAFTEAVKRIEPLRGDILVARVRDVIGANALIINSTSRVVRGTDIPSAAIEAAKTAMAEATKKAIGVGEGPIANAYGLMLGLSSHDISAMRELIGRPERVLMASQRHGGRAITASFDYGHFVCQFETAVDLIPHFDAHLEVSTPKEVIRVDYDTPYIRHQPARLTVLKPHGEAGASTEVSFPTRYDSFAVEWNDFHRNVTERRRPKTSIADAREDLELFKAMAGFMIEAARV